MTESPQSEEYSVCVGFTDIWSPYTEHVEFREMERLFGPATDVELETLYHGEGYVYGVTKKGWFKVRARSQREADHLMHCFRNALLNTQYAFENIDIHHRNNNAA